MNLKCNVQRGPMILISNLNENDKIKMINNHKLGLPTILGDPNKVIKRDPPKININNSICYFDGVPNEIIGEILKYTKFSYGRLINKNFKTVRDEIELSNIKPLNLLECHYKQYLLEIQPKEFNLFFITIGEWVTYTLLNNYSNNQRSNNQRSNNQRFNTNNFNLKSDAKYHPSNEKCGQISCRDFHISEYRNSCYKDTYSSIFILPDLKIIKYCVKKHPLSQISKKYYRDTIKVTIEEYFILLCYKDVSFADIYLQNMGKYSEI